MLLVCVPRTVLLAISTKVWRDSTAESLEMKMNSEKVSFIPPSLTDDGNTSNVQILSSLRPHVFDLLDSAVETMVSSRRRDLSKECTTCSSKCSVDGVSGENDKSYSEDKDAQLRRRLDDDGPLHEILEIADFLFGPLLESALALLDPCSIAENDATSSISVAPRCEGSRMAGVRKVCAYPSGRIAYFVRGSASPGRKKRGRFTEYLCLMNGPFSSYYCSCRSFYDKIKQNSSNDTKMGSIGHSYGGALCKHLLAAKMAPILDYGYEETEVSDERLAELILQSSLQDL